MKLTKEQLKQIIKEELEAVMNEGVGVGQKTNAGSSRTQAYGDQTLGDTAARQASERDAATRSRQDASYRANEIGKQAEQAEKDLKQLAKMNRILTKNTLSDLENWKAWKQAKRAWEASDKTRNDYTKTIGTVLIDSLDAKVRSLARKDPGGASRTKQEGELVKKIAHNWYLSQEAKYEAQIKEKGRSFMQKAGSFLTGKGFKEE